MTVRRFPAVLVLLSSLALSACAEGFAADARATEGLVPTDVFLDRALTQYGVAGGSAAPTAQRRAASGTGV